MDTHTGTHPATRIKQIHRDMRRRKSTVSGFIWWNRESKKRMRPRDRDGEVENSGSRRMKMDNVCTQMELDVFCWCGSATRGMSLAPYIHPHPTHWHSLYAFPFEIRILLLVSSLIGGVRCIHIHTDIRWARWAVKRDCSIFISAKQYHS